MPTAVCLVSDFYHPNIGGVETHIYQLAQAIRARGHKVVVATHAYGDRRGVRYTTAGLKVYYLPFPTLLDQCIVPTLWGTMPLLRQVFLRERVAVVHGHSAFSALAHEALLLAQAMGLKVGQLAAVYHFVTLAHATSAQTVFTDHSLLEQDTAVGLIVNSMLCLTLSLTDRIICVSEASATLQLAPSSILLASPSFQTPWTSHAFALAPRTAQTPNTKAKVNPSPSSWPPGSSAARALRFLWNYFQLLAGTLMM
eukprot:m.245562 g.245562  ORF g.245562 m.245562 type:complete len:254 (-) comp10958_c1_seq6:981-1742(-)